MKKQRQIGLVLEGDASNSALLNLPGLGPMIDLVKSSSLRSARRFSNAFRLGDAVQTYEDLQNCRIVLVKVPDSELLRVLSELGSAVQDGTMPQIAICESWVSTDMLHEARAIDTKLATATPIPSPLGRWFIAEGDTVAVRQLRRILEDCQAKVVPIDRGTKSLYFTAELMMTAAPLPALTAARGLLREAGLSGNVLSSVVEQLLSRMYRNFRAGHRLAFAGPLAGCPEHIASDHLARARATSPEITSFLQEYMRYTNS